MKSKIPRIRCAWCAETVSRFSLFPKYTPFGVFICRSCHRYSTYDVKSAFFSFFAFLIAFLVIGVYLQKYLQLPKGKFYHFIFAAIYLFFLPNLIGKIEKKD